MTRLDNLTFENCLKIMETNENFKMKTTIVEGTEIIQMNYSLAGYEDFNNPMRFSNEKIEGLKAFEIRGLTFIKSEDNTYKRYIMLKKFFNINQTLNNFVDDLKDEKIERVQDKLDGSLIRFIPLNNGKIIPKTKFDLDNKMTEMATKIYNEDKNLKEFLKESIDNNLSALFELISPFNRIVLPYNETELRLLQLRDEMTGEHYDIYDNELVKKYQIKTTKKFENEDTLEDIVDMAKTTENKEGWIVTFKNGHMVKIKTEWYFVIHRAISSDTLKENVLIEAVCQEVIDDILSQIPLDHKEKRDFVENVSQKVSNYINHNSKRIFKIVNEEFKQDNKKDFAIKYKNDELFGALMNLTKDNNIDKAEKNVKEFVLKNYRNYEKSKEWVESLPLHYNNIKILNNKNETNIEFN